MSTTATNNPFTYMWNGAKKMLKTNIIPYVLTMFATVGAVILITILVSALFLNNVAALNWSEIITRIVVAFITIGAVSVLILTFVMLIQERLMLTGVRSKKISFASAFSLSKDRYVVMLKIVVGLLGALFVAGLVVALIAAVAPVLAGILAVLLAATALVLLILHLPTLAVLTLTVVDNKKPLGVKDVFEQSAKAAQPIKGKIWLLVLVLIGGSLVIGALTGGYSNTNTTTYQTTGNSSFTTTSVERKTPAETGANNLLNGVLGFFVSCGITELYVLTHKDKSAHHKPAKSKA